MYYNLVSCSVFCRCKIPISIAADNSMFTVYDFFSHHLETSVVKVNEDGIPMFHYQNGYVDNKAMTFVNQKTLLA